MVTAVESPDEIDIFSPKYSKFICSAIYFSDYRRNHIITGSSRSTQRNCDHGWKFLSNFKFNNGLLDDAYRYRDTDFWCLKLEPGQLDGRTLIPHLSIPNIQCEADIELFTFKEYGFLVEEHNKY